MLLIWLLLLAPVAGSAPGTCPSRGAEGTCDADEEESLLLQVRGKHVEEELAAASPATLLAQVVPVTSAIQFPEPRRSARKALAFSGGGSRSLSLVMGQLRALEEIGVLPGNVDAVSAVSGGTWATSQYFYARKPTVELIGKPTVPSQLDMATLSSQIPLMAVGANSSFNDKLKEYVSSNYPRCNSFAWNSADRSRCVEQLWSNAWITVMSTVMLGHYGLDQPKYMAASRQQVQQIISRNRGLKARDFVTPRKDRPKTFVMNGCLLAPAGYAAEENNTVSFQMSPDYVGSPFYPDNQPVRYYRSSLKETYFFKPTISPGIAVGGGIVESFAFGGQAPEGKNSWSAPVAVRAPGAPFSLGDAVGISSAAFANAFTTLFPGTDLTPKRPYFPVTEYEKPASTFGLGDGGNLDNTGLLPMLQNEATSIAVFINTYVKLNASMNLCSVTAQEDLTEATDSALSCYFGFCNQSWQDRLSGPYGNNQVFARTDFPELLCSLQRQKAQGKPGVVPQKLKVQENTWWGIKGGSVVDVIWFYNEQVRDFESQLPPDTQDELRRGARGAFKNFPQYSTLLQNPPEVTSLTGEQINLLAAQGEYSVLQYRDEFCRTFGCEGADARTSSQ